MISLDEINRVVWREWRPAIVAELIRQFHPVLPTDWDPTDEELEKVLRAVSEINEERERWLEADEGI